MKIIFLVLLIVSGSIGYEINGTCPLFDDCFNPSINISDSKIWLGVWFVSANIRFPFQEFQKCSFINFFPTNIPNQVDYIKYETNNITNLRRENGGHFTFSPPNRVDITYSTLNLPYHFRLLELNDEFWAFVVCQDCGFYSTRDTGIHVYAFTRSQFPSQDVVNRYKAAFDRCEILSYDLIKQDQDQCEFC